MMKNFREFGIRIAKDAGAFLRRTLDSEHTVNYKGAIDLVTEADRASEEIIVSELHRVFPGHDILAEEFTRTCKGSDFRWIIDPLDGTTNYAHGYPVFSVSVALELLNEIVLGIVYNPMLEELFIAEKGMGASLNAREIHVSSTSEMGKSLLATGFPYDVRDAGENNLNNFNEMIMNARGIRRAGSAALDLAYVAAGRFDGFWELGLKPWDTAAGWLLVEEAGGVVTDVEGNKYSVESRGILTSNGKIHAEMLGVVSGVSSIL